MRFISLFAGVGGFDLALERAGHECVYANEWDKYCKIIYDKHFCHRNKPSEQGYGAEAGWPSLHIESTTDRQQKQDISNTNTRQYDYRTNGLDTRSITEVTTDEIPDHDLLVGGFPCQSFSIAGKRGGFSDTRGTMFFEIARILQAKKPRLFILENVKGLLSHDEGNTFKTIISTLDELGYDLQWQVLNSKNFGVPQNRERVFIIGHLRGTSRPQVFPIGEGIGGDIESGSDDTVSRTISARFAKGVGNTESRIIDVLVDAVQSQRIRNIKGLASTLSAGGGGQGAKTGLYGVDAGIRRLTPTECERLQGFPDGWTEGVSDTQRYKMMGNAVTVNVVEYLLQSIKC